MTPAQEKIARWRKDPVCFVREEFKTEPDDWQKELLTAFANNDNPAMQRIAAKACKGPGKTAALAWCIWNFLICYGEVGEHPKGAATSITADNLKDNLWPELAKWQNRSQLLKNAFTWTKERIFANDHPETWFFSARTWPKSADREKQANTLAGLHSKYLLFVIDESGGVPDSVMAAAEGGLATKAPGHFLKILQAGNPTHLEGPLYRACTTERRIWTVIEITGDPDDPHRSKRISIEWARQQIEKYGRNNPWVLVNVFGQFPPSSINVLLGPDDVSAAMKRHLREDEYNWAQKRLGIDVARFGDDRTVIFPRQGLAAFRPVIMRHARDSAVSVEIANRVMMAKSNWKSEMEFIDDTVGWAHGARDVLVNAGYGPIAISFNGKAPDPKYKNIRAYMWLMMAQWVLKGGALPFIPELITELCAPTYWYEAGQFVLEEKDQIKDRLGFSPDLGDALALTFAQVDMPGQFSIPGIQMAGQKMQSDWNPFDEKRL